MHDSTTFLLMWVSYDMILSDEICISERQNLIVTKFHRKI